MDAFDLGEVATARPLKGYGAASFPANENHRSVEPQIHVGGSQVFWAIKRVFDIAVALLALPFVVLVGFVLLAVNPFLNSGPLLYSQLRMGRFGKAFPILKFRTMVATDVGQCAAFASKETDRIRKLGGLIRRFRIDELPQMFNVLRGEMSLIGPRPEQLDFVETFSKTIPGYQKRHAVRPGISGYAQVTNGYADCEKSTKQKLDKDLVYIREAGWKMESYVFFRTLWVVMTGFGAL